MMAVEFQGAKELRDMAQQLRTLNRDLQLGDEATASAELEALKPAVRRSATTVMPHHGGLNRLIANSNLTVVRQGKSVTLRAMSKSNIRRMNNQGIIRHPVFGRPNRSRSDWRWVDQSYPRAKRWFDNPTLSAEMRLRRAIDRNRQRILNRVR